MGAADPIAAESDFYEFSFSYRPPRRKRAGASFVVSLLVHAAVVALAWEVNLTPTARVFPMPRLAELLDEQDRSVVLYQPRNPLPAVAPVQPVPTPKAAERPRYRLPQNVSADDPNPQSLKQMIRTDAPELIARDVRLPNIVSWKGPKVEMPRYQPSELKLTAPSTRGLPALEPPKIAAETKSLEVSDLQELARLRYQQQQRAAVSPEARALDAEKAPELAAAAAQLDVARFQELARLRYQGATDQPATAAPSRRALADAGAPKLSDANLAPGVTVSPAELQRLALLRYQTGQSGAPNPSPGRKALGEIIDGPSPEVNVGPVGGSSLDPSRFQQLSRLRYQGAEAGSTGAAPAQRSLAGAEGEAPQIAARASTGVLEGVGALRPTVAPPSGLGDRGKQSGGTEGDRNLVAVSVDPADRLPNQLPSGSRSGSFSAGPDGGPGGGKAGVPGATAGLRVPNLSIAGPRSAPSLPAGEGAGGDGKGGPGLLERLVRRTGLGDLISTPPPKIESDADAKRIIDLEDPFFGRPVYTMAVNMPNVTSYRGDWVMQFAILEQGQEVGPGDDVEERLAFNDEDLTPPYPLIKVDPKYVADAVREKIEGVVVFYCVIHKDGGMTDLDMVKSLDPRLDQAARDAFAKWRFEAARKDGKPVTVETIVRIPFQLNPAVKMRY